MQDQYRVENEAALQEIIGEPFDFVVAKIKKSLDEPMSNFIRQSPLVFVSTIDEDGNIDTSPKGDPPGFVQIDKSGNLIIPERPGNRLAFGFKNILRNSKIGLIFVIPNQRETLRIKGTATLHRDPDVLSNLQVNNKPALLFTSVAIEACFFHCGKAMIRSKVWKPESWDQPSRSPMVKQFATAMGGDEDTEKEFDEALEENYRDELY
ncbi:MAG: MSMEG_1061 family FMN-dependent PPOX-type flavoprotein [Pseudomonadota bacterium]